MVEKKGVAVKGSVCWFEDQKRGPRQRTWQALAVRGKGVRESEPVEGEALSHSYSWLGELNAYLYCTVVDYNVYV